MIDQAAAGLEELRWPAVSHGLLRREELELAGTVTQATLPGEHSFAFVCRFWNDLPVFPRESLLQAIKSMTRSISCTVVSIVAIKVRMCTA